MARTRLFGQLSRALRLAAAAETRRVSTSEAVERALSAEWSRRQFLKSAAVMGAGITFAPALRSMPRLQGDAPRVVIVGAGCAGLACAYRLQQAGVSAQVLEAGKRVGGRMFSLRDGLPYGQTTELGGEFIDSGHESLLNFASELGLTLIDLHGLDDGMEEIYHFGGRRVSYEAIVEAFRPLAARILEDLDTVTGDGDILYNATNNAEALDRMSLAEWFETREVTGDLRALLDVAYVGEYGLETDQQTPFNLLWLIGAEPGEFAIYGESDERYRIAEGNESIPALLAGALERPVELETRLEAVRQTSSGAYTLTVNQAGRTRDINADLVVMALPFTLLRQVDMDVELPEVKRLAIDTLGYGTNAKLMAAFETRVWHEYGADGSTYTDLPYQSSWETTRGQEGLGGVITNYLGGRAGVAVGEGTPEDRATEFVAQFDQVFTGAQAAYTGQALRYHWPSAPLTMGSYSCYMPGQMVAFRGAEGEAVGGLFFAGEHTSLEAQGYMNGASESGERAAQEVLEYVGVTA
jgi:monoamine oxidase